MSKKRKARFRYWFLLFRKPMMRTFRLFWQKVFVFLIFENRWGRLRSFLTPPVSLQAAKVAFHYLWVFRGIGSVSRGFTQIWVKVVFPKKTINLLILEQVSCNHLVLHGRWTKMLTVQAYHPKRMIWNDSLKQGLSPDLGLWWVGDSPTHRQHIFTTQRQNVIELCN